IVDSSVAMSISPLQGLLEVGRLVRAEEDLPSLLDAIARTISESLGYETVVINLFRPAWNDFCVTTVHGNDEARDVLLGRVRRIEEWEDVLSERFERRGAYVVPAGSYAWADAGYSYVPDIERADGDDAWDPEDGLFVPMRHHDGHLLGILSVDVPVSRRRPSDEELDVIVSVADHAALAVQAAQAALAAARHRLGLEQLLRISSRLTLEPDADEIMRDVCVAVRDALGFQCVSAALIDRTTGRLTPRAAVGWDPDEIVSRPLYLEDFGSLLDPAFEIEGCFLLPNEEAQKRVPPGTFTFVSQRNGRGPHAWNRHWLMVPLRDGEGQVIGLLVADEPEDRLIPSEDTLQALRIFANQAASAIVAAERVHELRFLAEHDPLTRLLNRRAFVDRLESEVARATRYGRSVGLVLCDLDGFKDMNDQFGHLAGDAALQTFADVVTHALRRPDDAFRIGGDEFAFLLAEASEDDAREVVRRVTSQLESSDDEQLRTVRASFGVASCPEDASDAQALFRLADEALYEAKRTGSGLQFVA
ncbi:MAG TPA: sensor domain-containing diguanylate cyclase, partial [Gaiellaceae bacterium]|nr:sensor domain-containing diguanylate cyclase [Gaiellaceae bacterium]